MFLDSSSSAKFDSSTLLRVLSLFDMEEREFLNRSLAQFRGYSNTEIDDKVLNEALGEAKRFIKDNGAFSGGKVASICAPDLQASLVAMDAMILLRAENSLRPYHRREKMDWNHSVKALWHVLEMKEGKRYPTTGLPYRLRESVRNYLKTQASDVDNMSPFFSFVASPNPCYSDFDIMLEYLAWQCWEAQEEVEMPKKRSCVVM
jgi:hypothetical protein